MLWSVKGGEDGDARSLERVLVEQYIAVHVMHF